MCLLTETRALSAQGEKRALLKFVWVTLARFTSAMTDQAVSGSTTGRQGSMRVRVGFLGREHVPGARPVEADGAVDA